MIQLYLTLINGEEDKVRFEHAYYRYRKLMHREAKKILKDDHRAEDAVQEAFFRIARNFHKVGAVEAKETRNFFVLITRRAALNLLEREEHFCPASEEDLTKSEPLVSTDSADAPLHETELMQAVFRLPQAYRDVLYLRGVYGYEMKEIAEMLGITVEAAWKRFYRGRSALEKEMEREE